MGGLLLLQGLLAHAVGAATKHSDLSCYDQTLPNDLGFTAYVNVRNDVNVWFYRTWTPKIGDEGLLQRTCLQTAPDGVVYLGLVKDMTHGKGLMHERMVTCVGTTSYDKILEGTNPSWLTLVALKRNLGYVNEQDQFTSFNLYTAYYEGKWHLFSEIIYLVFPSFDDHNVMPFTKVNVNITDRERVGGSPVSDCQVDWRHFSLSEAERKSDLLKGTPFYRKRCEGKTPYSGSSVESADRFREALSGATSLGIPSTKWKKARELTPKMREVFSRRFKCEEVRVLRPRVQQSLMEQILRTVTTALKAALFGAGDVGLKLLSEWQKIDPYVVLKGLLLLMLYTRTGSLLVTVMAMVVVQGWLWILGVERM